MKPISISTPSFSVPQRGRPKWAKAGVIYLLFLLLILLGAVSPLGRMAISDRQPPAARREEDQAGPGTDYRSESPAGLHHEILAHHDLIPSHNHPLLGRPAPDWQLTDLGGRTWTLRQLVIDAPVVLHFSHTSCSRCMRQLFESTNDLTLFRELGARVVAITPDTPELMQQRFEQYRPLGFPVLSDTENKAAEAYEVFRRTSDGKRAGRLLHGTFIIAQGGIVTWVNVGDAPFQRNSALRYQLAKIELSAR
jgi:peroxiredoxin